uniref:non-specific serine/threonine protein kinase n=1 Tax=Oryza glaberrima TaxID=4538 RepID=I1NJQ7_ORYGL
MSSKFLAIYLLLAFLSHGTCSYMATTASGWDDHDFFRHCPPSRCSKDGPEIRFPHRLESSNTSSACGASCARLACSGQDTMLHHPILGPCKVTSIDYKEAVINIIHLLPFPCPLQKLMVDSLPPDDYHGCNLYRRIPAKIVSCSKEFTPSGTSPVPYELDHLQNAAENIFGPISCLSGTGQYFSYLVHAQLYMYLLPLDCRIVSRGSIPIPGSDSCSGPTFKEKAEKIINFAETTVSWGSFQDGVLDNCMACERQKQLCAFSSRRNQTFCTSHGNHHATSSVAAFVVFSFIMATALYLSLKSRYDEEVHLKVEMFLRTYGTSKPTRYSFSDVKKITRRFKEQLGQGGFGSVYKGRLPNGVPVAVKMIEHSTGNGEEFINEVATIGQIHHINIARLLGFCSEGTRHILIYEFMPNESLEKCIFLHDPNTSQELLAPKKMLDVALGIARGMEYLHQGCNQRILHFDTKPNNILLDYNFNPKISDFGLAKLCARDQSIVTLTKARGTMGYIAPELYSRNFGEISYKSDVYSFGMLVLEMVSGRRNSDPSIENQNEVYFPEWIYEKVITEQDFVLSREMTEEDRL